MGADVTDIPVVQGKEGVTFTPAEAQLLNGLLDQAGAKGSEGKRLMANAQEKIERFLPPDASANGDGR